MKLKKYLYKRVESTNNVALRLIKQGNQKRNNFNRSTKLKVKDKEK